jgi:hypothetical protein
MNKLGRHTKKDKVYSILGKIVVISFVFMLLFSQEANMLSFQEKFLNTNSELSKNYVNTASDKKVILDDARLLWMKPLEKTYKTTSITLRTILADTLYAKALLISKKAADYVISKAVPEGNGLKWAFQSRYTHYNPIFENGAAGVGYFLLNLYRVTQNTTYLQYAEKAAAWIIAEAQERDGGFTWSQYDDDRPREWSSGWYLTPEKSVSGVARFLLELYKTTSKTNYLYYAEGAANWIINVGLVKTDHGSYVEYNPYHQAAFGVYSYPQRDVGVLFLDLYEATGKTLYLDKAKEIGDWILSTSECNDNICKWYDDRGYGNLYVIEGIAPLVDFLYKLHKKTGNPSYLNTAEKMVNWVETKGVWVSSDKVKFLDLEGKYRTIIWGFWDRLLSVMTPADVFLWSYEITGNSKRLGVADAYLNWLISISVSEGNGLKIPEVEGMANYHAWVNARIYNYIMKLYSLNSITIYLDYAEKLLNWIIYSAADKNGYVWPYDGREFSTFSLGSSGIGYYVIAPFVTQKQIETTISVEDPVPFDRLFSINLRVKNLDNIPISLKITLEERTGFQAGPKYGDGDEIKEITLNPGQEAELTFKAKVYGIQRIGDVARFKFYIGDKLVGQKDQILNLKPEVIEVSTFTSPAAVKKGSSFTIGVPVFYSLSMDTVLALILINEENGKKIVISDVVKGEGLKIYSIKVNSTIADLNLEGIKSFKLTVQSEYPEENYRVAYKKEFSFKVRVSNDVGSSSIVLDSGLVITLNYGGKQYYALYAYNATSSSPSQSGNIEDSFKWAYSQRNWLVFENIKGSFKPVMDDELYKTLAFAAEIAFLRATFWNNDYLVSRSNFFKDLRDLAIALETLNFIAKVAGKIAGMIALKSANSWASSVLSGTEASKLTRDLAMSVKITIEILEKIKLYENVLEAINKVGGAKEEVLVWLSIFLLNGGSDDLIAANKMLPNLTPYQPFVINVSDALTFYSYIQSGETKGLAAMRFLSTFYGKDQIDVMGVKISIRPFKGALIEALGFVGTAYEFYENLKNNFNNNEVFEYAQHLASVWMNYEIRKLICQSASLKFRDTYIRETSNSMEISLTEPGTQRKLYLTIYDTEGRIVGFDRKSGNIVSGIPNSYYLDFGNAIIIYVPLNVKIEKIVVDAIKSEQPIENYSLMIQVYKEGNLVSSTSLSSQININTKKEYSLQLTGDLKPILNELTTTPTTPSPSPTITSPTQTLTTSPSAAPLNIELIIIIIVIAAILASLVIVFRKYKAK